MSVGTSTTTVPGRVRTAVSSLRTVARPVLLEAPVCHRVQPGAGDRIPGREQRHVPAAGDQAFGNVAGHRFPGATMAGRCSPGDR
jgi:hypothetical protein